MNEAKLTGFVVELTMEAAWVHTGEGALRGIGFPEPTSNFKLELKGTQVVEGGFDAFLGRNVEIVVRLKPEPKT